MKLPKCDILIWDEIDYAFNSEFYAPLSYSLFNGVWDLSEYACIFAFTATVGSYLTDVIKSTITKDVKVFKIGSEYEQLTGNSHMVTLFIAVPLGMVFESICNRVKELYETIPMVIFFEGADMLKFMEVCKKEQWLVFQ